MSRARRAHFEEAQASIGTAAHALDDALGQLMRAKAPRALIRRLRDVESDLVVLAVHTAEARESVS